LNWAKQATAVKAAVGINENYARSSALLKGAKRAETGDKWNAKRKEYSKSHEVNENYSEDYYGKQFYENKHYFKRGRNYCNKRRVERYLQDYQFYANGGDLEKTFDLVFKAHAIFTNPEGQILHLSSLLNTLGEFNSIGFNLDMTDIRIICLDRYSFVAYGTAVYSVPGTNPPILDQPGSFVFAGNFQSFEKDGSRNVVITEYYNLGF
jgi:hypothetical protein